jgi:hypothetical protein
VRRNLEGVVAKRKTGTYATVSGWLKIKNPNYTQSERRHELFDKFKAKAVTVKLPPVPKKPPLRESPLVERRLASRGQRDNSGISADSVPALPGFSPIVAEQV